MNIKEQMELFAYYCKTQKSGCEKEMIEILFNRMFSIEEKKKIIEHYVFSNYERLIRVINDYGDSQQEELRRNYSIKIKNEYPVPKIKKRKEWVNSKIYDEFRNSN